MRYPSRGRVWGWHILSSCLQLSRKAALSPSPPRLLATSGPEAESSLLLTHRVKVAHPLSAQEEPMTSSSEASLHCGHRLPQPASSLQQKGTLKVYLPPQRATAYGGC